MRVTDNMRYQAALVGQAVASERVLQLTRVATSGMRVGGPSDDPVAFASITRRDAQLHEASARQSGAQRAADDLAVADGALASAYDLMVRAREIAIQMANGAVDAKTRAAGGAEITAIRQQLVGLANTRGAHGYLFSGTKTDTPAVDEATGAFLGNDHVVQVELAAGVTTAANANGAKAFTVAGGRDVFADLQTLATALAANDVPGVTASLDPLEAGQRQLTATRGDTGMTIERLQSASTVMGDAILGLKKSQAGEQEADVTETLSGLEQARAAYERGVAVTRQILSLTSLAQG